MLVENLEHLKQLSDNGNNDYQHFSILLAGGLARSGKRILYTKENDEFSLIHEIDESCIDFFTCEIIEKTNLMEAIEKKCLFYTE